MAHQVMNPTRQMISLPPLCGAANASKQPIHNRLSIVSSDTLNIHTNLLVQSNHCVIPYIYDRYFSHGQNT